MSQQNAPFGFKIRQRIFAFRATYDIFDMATDQQLFKAKKKIFSFGKTIIIEDLQGREVVKIKGNVIFNNNWTITQNNQKIGMVRFPLIRFCGIKFTVELLGNIYNASDLLGYSFNAVNQAGHIGFSLNRRILSIRDTYKVDVYPPLEPVFGLAAALAIDAKYFQGQN